MNSIQSNAPGMVAPGATALDAVSLSSNQETMRGLAEVILLAGLAAAQNNEAQIKAAHQEVLELTRTMQNCRREIQAQKNRGNKENTYEYTDPKTGQTSTVCDTHMQHGAVGSCAGAVVDAVKDITAFMDGISANLQMAMQNLQAAVSRQNELNQMISQNMSKLHETAGTALSKMV